MLQYLFVLNSHTKFEFTLFCLANLPPLHCFTQLPFGGLHGIAQATCILPVPPPRGATEGGLLAVGSRCGRVALLDAATMQVQELVAIAAGATSVGAPATVANATTGAGPGSKAAASAGKSSGGSFGMLYSYCM